MLTQTVFTIDGIADAYIGYTKGDHWNGWACPYFEVNEAMLIMQQYNESDPDSVMLYSESSDTFMLYDRDNKELTEWKGGNHQTTDGIKHLYGIGAGYWIWDDMGDLRFRKSLAQQIEEFIFYHDTYEFRDEYGIEREQAVESITNQFADLAVYAEAIKIFDNEGLTADDKFDKLGGVLKL